MREQVRAPGRVSPWREADRTVIARNALTATGREPACAMAVRRPEIQGPPMYFTPDRDAARQSVRRLAALEPELAVTGHGRALQGPQVREALPPGRRWIFPGPRRTLLLRRRYHDVRLAFPPLVRQPGGRAGARLHDPAGRRRRAAA